RLERVRVALSADVERRAVRPDSFHFYRRRDGGDEDRGRHADLHGGEGHGNSVIAARRGNHPCRRRLSRDQVRERTARFERAAYLKQLELQVDVAGVYSEILAPNGEHRRFSYIRGDASRGQ